MANDKYYGYRPKRKKGSLGVPFGNDPRLENVNPYEFKKGMDWELSKMGCPRLREATEEERTKATETILKNLKESDAYYSYQMAYETEYKNHQGRKPSFKSYLKEIESNKMQEVDKEYKNDKMVELKESIKKEIKSILNEGEYLGIKELNPINILSEDEVEQITEEEDEDKEATKGAKKAKASVKNLEKEKEKLLADKKKLQAKFKPLMQKFNDGKLSKEDYMKKVGDTPKEIKGINKRLGEIEKEVEKIQLKEKEDRREVAASMMERSVNMKLLEIIKEQGISLREGVDELKTYYEIARKAYMEGLTHGINQE